MPLYFVRLEGKGAFEVHAGNNGELYTLVTQRVQRTLPGEGAIVLVTHNQSRVVPDNRSAELPNTRETPFIAKRSRLGKSFLAVFLTPKKNTVDIIGLGCAQQKGAICGYAAVMNVRAAIHLLAAGRRSSEIVDLLPSLDDILAARDSFQIFDAESKRRALQELYGKLGKRTYDGLVAIADTKDLSDAQAAERVRRLRPGEDLLLDFEAIKSLRQPVTDWSTREDLHRFNFFVEETLEGVRTPPVYEEMSSDGRALLYSDYRVEQPGETVYICSSGLPVEDGWAAIHEAHVLRPEIDRKNICARRRFLNGEPIPIVERLEGFGEGFGGMGLLPSLVMPYLREGKSIAWVSPQGRWSDNHWKGIILKLAPEQRVPVENPKKNGIPTQVQDLGLGPTVVSADGPAGFSLRVYVLDSMTSGVATLHDADAKFVELLLDNDTELYGPCCEPGVAVPAYCYGDAAASVRRDAVPSVRRDAVPSVRRDAARGGAGAAVDDDEDFDVRSLAIEDDGRLKWDCPICDTQNVDIGGAAMECRRCKERFGRTGGRQRHQTHLHDWHSFIRRRKVHY